MSNELLSSDSEGGLNLKGGCARVCVCAYACVCVRDIVLEMFYGCKKRPEGSLTS